MNIEEYRDFCLSLPLCEESMPFGDVAIVYKIGGKMFSLAMLQDFERFSVKCNPDIAIQLRDSYTGVKPAWHFNKRHWNDIYVDSGLSDEFMKEQIRNSYFLVIENITPKSLKEEIKSKINR